MAAILDGEGPEAAHPRSPVLSVTTLSYEMQKVSSRFIDECPRSQGSSRRELTGGRSHHQLAGSSEGQPHLPSPTGLMQAPRPAEHCLSGESALHSQPHAADQVLFIVSVLRHSVQTVSRHQRERAGPAEGSEPSHQLHAASLGSA